jgi:glycolate oxidase FAD binding subunit
MSDAVHRLEQEIRAAARARRLLRIRGGGTKDFYGGALEGEPLETTALSGIIDYEPTELVISARAGTALEHIESALAHEGQMLGCEPPRFGPATLGGAVASGLAGPRRAYCGAVRDFVLGVELIDGRGERLRFGGRVIKNVAGFDVSRLMAGSLGTLGVLTAITLKTLPRPPRECTLRFEMDQPHALESMSRWAARPLPISATAWQGGVLHLRLAGAEVAVAAARRSLGGELHEAGERYWEDVREQRLALFGASEELWRVSLPAGAPVLALDAPLLIEWGGALRWMSGPLEGGALRAACSALGGHCMVYRARRKPAEGPFPRTSAALLALQRRLKAVFDPHGIFNRGRLDPSF